MIHIADVINLLSIGSVYINDVTGTDIKNKPS